MHLSSHLVHIDNVRSVVRVRVDTHTDQFPKLQGKEGRRDNKLVLSMSQCIVI